jgi:putative endonuclease
MSFFIYILYSPSSDIYYVGHTENVLRRMDQHNNPLRSKFTSKHLPWVLKVSFVVSQSRSGAMIAEKYIKKKKSRKYLEELIGSREEQGRIALKHSL